MTEHFVYVYRDKQGNPVYFGQGKHATRPASHKAGSHNVNFDEWLKNQGGQHKVEVIGPVGSKDMADALETALISACMPARKLRGAFFNIHKGPSRYRFRSFGVPDRFAARTTDLLDQRELRRLSAEHGPLMFVRINQKDFDDGPGRRGYDLASPPTDAEIRARIECWWQVARRVEEWANKPISSPALLLGVTGGPGAQTVIASARVARPRWRSAESAHGGLLKIPLVGDGLDAAKLRGRPISPDVGLRFNQFRHSQYRIMTTRGFEHEFRHR